ncbi:M23 family peptidase, partial [Campylobacter sp. TTU-622]|nr:M23 family peptidase [Campylobacter sp. TTU-622]
MKKIFIFLFFLQFLFAEENVNLIKGQALFLEFDKKDLQQITLNDKKINFFIHPNDKNKVVIIFSLPY